MATLPERSAAEVEEHLLSCSLCQKRLVEIDEFLTVFRAAAIQVDARPAQQPERWPSRIIACAGAAAVFAALLVFLISGERQNAKPSAMLVMQSFRGPEAAARMVSGRPYRLACAELSFLFEMTYKAITAYFLISYRLAACALLRIAARGWSPVSGTYATAPVSAGVLHFRARHSRGVFGTHGGYGLLAGQPTLQASRQKLT